MHTVKFRISKQVNNHSQEPVYTIQPRTTSKKIYATASTLSEALAIARELESQMDLFEEITNEP